MTHVCVTIFSSQPIVSGVLLLFSVIDQSAQNRKYISQITLYLKMEGHIE